MAVKTKSVFEVDPVITLPCRQGCTIIRVDRSGLILNSYDFYRLIFNCDYLDNGQDHRACIKLAQTAAGDLSFHFDRLRII